MISFLGRRCAQNAILDIGCVPALWHPDTFLQHDAVDAAQVIGKDRKPLFQSERFEVNKTRRIEYSVAVFVRAQIICALIENNLFIYFCQQQVWLISLDGRDKQSMLHASQRTRDCASRIAALPIRHQPFTGDLFIKITTNIPVKKNGNTSLSMNTRFIALQKTQNDLPTFLKKKAFLKN